MIPLRRGLYYQHRFFRGFDLSFPAIGGCHAPDRIDAGSQSPADQRLRQPGGRIGIAAGGQYEQDFCAHSTTPHRAWQDSPAGRLLAGMRSQTLEIEKSVPIISTH